MGGLFPPPFNPSAGGGGIPNATVFWASVGPLDPPPFLIRKSDGKITGDMFGFRSSGVYTLDMSSLLSIGIYAAFISVNFNQAVGAAASIANSAFTGDFVPPAMAIGFAFTHWTGSTFLVFDPDFSIIVLGQ